ncbi:hypothetical protein, partial [Enterobacter cloacae]|uniref:hypothetical protein n=1 Tax=Enterobacter cloacae TaxID=550 RepID=UPI0039C1D81C
ASNGLGISGLRASLNEPLNAAKKLFVTLGVIMLNVVARICHANVVEFGLFRWIEPVNYCPCLGLYSGATG